MQYPQLAGVDSATAGVDRSQTLSRWGGEVGAIADPGGEGTAKMSSWPTCDGAARNTPGPTGIQFKPGLADQTLRELAPLLAEEGIDVDNINVPTWTPCTGPQPRGRAPGHGAVHPIGRARELAAVTLRLVIEAVAEGNTTLAAAILC